jgi:hypothetical protein
VTEPQRPIAPTDEELRHRTWPKGGGNPIDKATVASEAFALRYIGEALVYLADIISSTTGPGPESWLPGAPVPCPTDSGDPVKGRDLPAAPPEVGDDPAGSDGSTATLGAAVGTGESPAPSSFEPCEYCGDPIHLHTFGELRSCFLDLRARSGAHAPDLPAAEAELDGFISYRSTGRGAYDVVQTRAEGPDVVLAMVQFSEGVRGRVHALERFSASLRQTSQDVTP